MPRHEWPPQVWVTPHEEIELHCTCGMPETIDGMVECDLYEKRFHLSCEGIISTHAVDERWLCEFCTVYQLHISIRILSLYAISLSFEVIIEHHTYIHHQQTY